MHKAISLTAALEDYLEAILNLCHFDQAARSRDIAEALNVHKSTVTAALKSLGQMSLVNYAPYEAVTLTHAGRKLAEDVAKRHGALKAFFVDVLKVDRELAESAACGMEHALPKEIVDRLARFAETMGDCPRLLDSRHTGQEACGACGEAGPSGAASPNVPPTLDLVAPTDTVRVISVKADSRVRKRLAEMGVTRGAEVTVERIAPMGDPMEIRIRGYRLSLRKEEACKVAVAPIHESEGSENQGTQL